MQAEINMNATLLSNFFLKEISIKEKWIIKQNIVVLHSTTLDGPIARKT